MGTLTSGVDMYDEAAFRKWFMDWAQRSGISQDPDHRDAKYDFRAAWKANKPPVWNESIQNYEWPEEFSYDKPDAPPAPEYKLTMTINGVKLVPEQPGGE